jgi:hypothetical protein
LATVLAQQARSAVVSNRLVSTTSEAARLFAAGQTAPGLLSAGAVILTEGVLQTMLLTKVKTITFLLVALAAVALSTAGALYQATASDEPETKAQPTRPAPRTDPLLTSRPAEAPLATTQPTPSDPPAETEKEPNASESTRPALPTCSMPRQALVGLEKHQLYVRTLDVIYEPITTRNGYEVRTSYQQIEVLKTRRYDLNMVKVYDVHGKRIAEKQLPRLLKKETVALVSADSQAADPLNLRLFKEGTLLFILPGAVGPQYYYEPVVPPQPVPAAPPVTAITPPATAPIRSIPSQPTTPRSVTPHADPASPIPYAPAIPLAPSTPAPTIRPAPTATPGK